MGWNTSAAVEKSDCVHWFLIRVENFGFPPIIIFEFPLYRISISRDG